MSNDDKAGAFVDRWHECRRLAEVIHQTKRDIEAARKRCDHAAADDLVREMNAAYARHLKVWTEWGAELDAAAAAQS